MALSILLRATVVFASVLASALEREERKVQAGRGAGRAGGAATSAVVDLALHHDFDEVRALRVKTSAERSGEVVHVGHSLTVHAHRFGQ